MDPEESDSEDALMMRHLSIDFFHVLHLRSTVSDNHFPHQEVKVFCNCLMPETYGEAT